MFGILYSKQNSEILLVCIISGIGMLYSGNLLDGWRKSELYDEKDELWIIITPLLGLKGNIEMTLASRLSTMVKLGLFKNLWKIFMQNIVIIQVQGLIVGLCVASLGFLLNNISLAISLTLIDRYIRLIFLSVLTASISSLILGSVTILVVYYSNKLGLDPDNIATPLAAALGDTVTLIVLFYCSLLCSTGAHVNLFHYVCLALIFAVIFPLLFSLIDWSDFPRFLPIFTGMILSSLSGLVLKHFMFRVDKLATFQPLVNGIGGNVASVFCSSLSTDCHKNKKTDNKCESKGLFVSLIVLSMLIHSIMLLFCSFVRIVSIFDIAKAMVPYLVTVACQVSVLLICSKKLVAMLWKSNIDPDNCSIPLVTGLGDLLGTSLLSISLSTIY